MEVATHVHGHPVYGDSRPGLDTHLLDMGPTNIIQGENVVNCII